MLDAYNLLDIRQIFGTMYLMRKFSTREAAKKLGLSPIALSRYIALGKVPSPEVISTGRHTLHLWTEEQIENVRKILPKIANGRKKHSAKKQLAASNKQLAKPKKKQTKKK